MRAAERRAAIVALMEQASKALYEAALLARTPHGNVGDYLDHVHDLANDITYEAENVENILRFGRPMRPVAGLDVEVSR